MKSIKKYILLPLPLLAASCTTTPEDCDPSRADFIRNTGCLASGAYETRQVRLQSELAREQQRNEGFRNVLNALDAEKAAVASNLQASQSRYNRLDGTWQKLRGDLLRNGAESAALERQIQSIDEQMVRRKSPGTADTAQQAQERDDLQRRLSLLHKEIDAGVY